MDNPEGLVDMLDSSVRVDVLRLQAEFSGVLRRYQECMQQLELDPENQTFRQNVVASRKDIVAVSMKQKLFVKQFREKSHMTPKAEHAENKVASPQSVVMENGGGSNGTPDDGGCNHCTPPESPKSSATTASSTSTTASSSTITTPNKTPPLLGSTPCPPTTFPSDVMEQEEFLKGFGLITHECLKTKSETKRVERRRRTTANPKYNSNGFVDLSHISRRTRRLEEPDSVCSSPKRLILNSTVKVKNLQPRCIICEQIGFNLTCESCQAQLHVECIRVSGSKAPAPTRLRQCPRCIDAMNERRLLGDLEDLKFQKPLIPSTPIIPINLKKKSISSGSLGVNQQSSSSAISNDIKPSTKTTSKLAKKPATAAAAVQVKTLATNKPAGSLGKGTIVGKAHLTKRAGNSLKVSKLESGGMPNLDIMGKPILNSPFKTLTTLTAKGAAAHAAKNLQTKLASGTLPGSLVNGTQPLKHKKSKISGVKAKTLSVTGNQSNSTSTVSTPTTPTSTNITSTKTTMKHKASPLNNINTNGNINSTPKPKLNIKSSSRLPKFNTDQHLSMQRTILAMTAAAKSVMSSNGMRVPMPVTLGVDLQINGNGSSEPDQSPRKNNDTSCVSSSPVLNTNLPSSPIVSTNDSPCSPLVVTPIANNNPVVNSINNTSVVSSGFKFNNELVVEKP